MAASLGRHGESRARVRPRAIGRRVLREGNRPRLGAMTGPAKRPHVARGCCRTASGVVIAHATSRFCVGNGRVGPVDNRSVCRHPSKIGRLGDFCLPCSADLGSLACGKPVCRQMAVQPAGNKGDFGPAVALGSGRRAVETSNRASSFWSSVRCTGFWPKGR